MHTLSQVRIISQIHALGIQAQSIHVCNPFCTSLLFSGRSEVWFVFPQITITVYNMAAVDFSTFFGAFVPHFLQNMDGLDTDQRTTLKANFKTDTVSHLFIFFIATLILRVYSSFLFFLFFFLYGGMRKDNLQKIEAKVCKMLLLSREENWVT